MLPCLGILPRLFTPHFFHRLHHLADDVELVEEQVAFPKFSRTPLI